MARSVLISDRAWPGSGAIRAQISKGTDEVFIALFGDGLLSSCFEVLADATNITLRTRTFGGSPSTITTGAGDTPPAGPAVVAHGQGTKAFVLDVRYFQGKFEIRVQGTLLIEYTDTTHAFLAYKHWGWGSTIANARINRIQLCELKEKVQPGAELLFIACGGQMWKYDGTDLRFVASGVFKPKGPVSLREYLQKLYGTDGEVFKVLDSTTDEIEPVVPTAGTLQGYTADVDGSTRLSFLETFFDRMLAAGDPQDPQNIHASALGDPLDWDYSAYLELPGSAFTLTSANKPKPGEPVRSLFQAATGVLLMPCERSTWRMAGDPSQGPPTITPISTRVGGSGKDAIAQADNDTTIMHSPLGLYIIKGASSIYCVSEVLTEGITLDPRLVPAMLPQVVWDADRSRAFVFLTAPGLNHESLHFIYDQRVGAWKPERGGFFPIQHNPAIGPNCSISWRGKTILGTYSGRLMAYDRAAKSDNVYPIECRFVYDILERPDLTHDSILHKLAIRLASDSDPATWKVYGGRTPEEAYERRDEWLLAEGTVEYGEPSVLPFRVRAPALILEISNNTFGTRIAVERVEVFTTVGRILTAAEPFGVPEPALACTSPVEDIAERPFDDGPGDVIDGGGGMFEFYDFSYDQYVKDMLVVEGSEDGGGGGPTPGLGNPNSLSSSSTVVE